MFQVAYLNFGGAVANPGNGGAGKIEAVVFEIEDNFYYVGVHDVRGGLDRSCHRRELGCGFFEQGMDGGVDGCGIEERLITLDVHEDVAFFVKRNFCDALGSGAMVGAGHAALAPEGFHGFHDAFVVGGDDDAAGERGQLGALVDVLNHGFAGQRKERLAGQAR